MTIEQISKQINKVRPLSTRQVRRYIQRLRLKPAGGKFKPRPYDYPENTAQLILRGLGHSIVSLPQLRAERAKAQKARAA